MLPTPQENLGCFLFGIPSATSSLLSHLLEINLIMTLSTEVSVTLGTPALKASTRTGMGSIPYEGGTAFRVWAPFASAVYVAGDFNNKSTTTNPLASENNGYWSVDVPEAKEGQKYRYLIQGSFIPADSLWWRTDPYCKHVLDNDGADESSD
ncbi:MAG: hypothetical protein V7L27_00235 [Nostoc sp.]